MMVKNSEKKLENCEEFLHHADNVKVEDEGWSYFWDNFEFFIGIWKLRK